MRHNDANTDHSLFSILQAFCPSTMFQRMPIFLLLAGILILRVEAQNEVDKGAKSKNLGVGVGPHKFDYLLGANSHVKSGAKVIFVDYETESSVIKKYQNEGKTVICYVNVGSWENWRSDKDDFPPEVIGNDYEGWPGEKWLDIRKTDILLPIMKKRYNVAKSKNCSGIDPDNMNGYTQDTGFPLTYDDQIAFNTKISQQAKAMGLLAGLKNDGEQANDLVQFTDFAVVEECAQYQECSSFSAFIKSGKPVFVIEYKGAWNESTFRKKVCPRVNTNTTSMSFILKEKDLRGNFIVSCL